MDTKVDKEALHARSLREGVGGRSWEGVGELGGTDFDDIPHDFIEWVEDHFNNKPMKVLNFKTPNQVWNQALNLAT